MGKRTAAAAACQSPGISQRSRRRKKERPGDAAPGLGSCSSRSTTTRISELKAPDEAAPDLGSRNTQAAQIGGVGPLKKRRPEKKRNKPDNAGGLRSCTAATSQAQVPRLPTRSLSWGAKRSRTALAGASRWRDWANLAEGPAGLIAERVLANDVAGYIRFRAVCPAWRRCCADPRARGGVLDDPRFYPRQWIMLRRAYEALDAAAAPHPIRRQFLNTSTGQCILVDIPELRDHGVFRDTTAEGLLLLPCKTTKAAAVVRLLMLNPLTRQKAELPAITRDLRHCSSAGLVDCTTVCLYFPPSRGGTLAIAKPGDDRWVLVNTGPELLSSTLYFAGRFYGATASAVMKVDMEAAGGPRLVVAAKLARRVMVMADSVYLVVNGRDLALVHRMVRQIPHPSDGRNFLYKKTYYMVYRVDLKAGKMRVMRNLGGRAIFMDTCGALSVSPQVFPFLSADTIYLEHLFGNGQPGTYHLRDGSTAPCNNVLRQNGEFERPWSIADCLTAYVSI